MLQFVGCVKARFEPLAHLRNALLVANRQHFEIGQRDSFPIRQDRARLLRRSTFQPTTIGRPAFFQPLKPPSIEMTFV